MKRWLVVLGGISMGVRCVGGLIGGNGNSSVDGNVSVVMSGVANGNGDGHDSESNANVNSESVDGDDDEMNDSDVGGAESRERNPYTWDCVRDP